MNLCLDHDNSNRLLYSLRDMENEVLDYLDTKQFWLEKEGTAELHSAIKFVLPTSPK